MTDIHVALDALEDLSQRQSQGSDAVYVIVDDLEQLGIPEYTPSAPFHAPTRGASMPGSSHAAHRVERKSLKRRDRPYAGYAVGRVAGANHEIVAHGYETFEAALQGALAHIQADLVWDSVYYIEYGAAATRVQGVLTERKLAKPRRVRWKVEDRVDDLPLPPRKDRREDRRGDLSLLSRSEEEIGLGIPAQTNRGRRSRKGDYIP